MQQPVTRLRRRATTLLAVALAFVAGCSESTSAPPAPLRLELSADSLALAAGHSETLVAVARRGTGPALTDVAVGWRSAAPAVADVDANGLVRARTAGTATITASVDTVSVSIPVRVYQRAEALALPASFSMYFSDTLRLALTAKDGAGNPTTSDSIVWTSSDPSVDVDSTGKVTATGWGTSAVITARRGSVVAQTTVTPTVTVLTAPTSFATISGTWSHTCALTAAGAAYCSGGGSNGELGNGTRNGGSWIAVTGGLTFVDLQAGQDQTCGLTAPGALYCWGNNSSGSIGQDTIDRTPTGTVLYLSPTLVVGGHSWRQFSVGAHKAVCAVTTDDAPYCWGHNDLYQVGRAPLAASNPYVLPPNGGLAYHAVGEGAFGGCGVTPAGATYCWGWSSLFVASGPNSPDPHLLPNLPPLVSVSAGDAAACGLTAAGAAWCWGDAYGGALGGGAYVALDAPSADRWSGATPVAGAHTFRKVSAGAGDDACGLTTSDELYCWGVRYHQGAAGTPVTPQRIGPTGTAFRDVNVGMLWTNAIDTNGKVYQW